MLMSLAGTSAFAHDIEVANADGVTIYYVWTNNNTELEVSCRGSYYSNYWNEYSGDITIPASVEYDGKTYNVTSVRSSAFRDCSSLISIIIPNSVTSIGNYAFSGCYLTSIVSEIEKPFEISNVFYNTPSNVGIIIPKGTRDTYMLTAGWSKFTLVEVGEGATKGQKIEDGGICYIVGENNTVSVTSTDKKYSGDVVLPDQVTYNEISYQVTSIGNNAFYSCYDLTSITMPNSITLIDYSAFENCRSLGAVIIPNNVTTIGSAAFSNCSGLTSITFPNSLTTIGSYAFRDCSNLTSVVIGNGITSIDYNAFSGANLRKTIWLTNTPPSGYNYASGTINYVSNDQFSSLRNTVKYQFLSSYFDVDGIRYVPVSPSERTCDAIDCVYNESAADTKISSTVVYKGVTMNVKNIKPYLAYNNKYIKTLTVDNDGELAEYAFTNCSNMESATLGQKVSAIGSYSFQGCSTLKAIEIPDAVKEIKDGTFNGCTNMMFAKIGSSVKTIDNSAFSGCSTLPSITIPQAVTDIKDYVFNNCTSLKEVIIADSESELNIGSNSSSPIFSSCPLDSVYIGRNINYNTDKNNGYSPFYRNTSLRAVKITDKETEISENEFYGCTHLQRVVIGDGVKSIGDWAFSGCQSLKHFAFGSQVKTIGKEAFSDCSAVIEIISKADKAPECGTQALDDINKWECKLYVPDGCMAVYQAAEQWKDFFFTEEGEGTEGQGGGAGTNPEDDKKCETPTISIDGSTVRFDCKTNGVIFHYTLSSADAKSDLTNSGLEIKNNYVITVYATKEGFADSEVARSEFQVASAGKQGDVNGDGQVNVADHVKLTEIIIKQ